MKMNRRQLIVIALLLMIQLCSQAFAILPDFQSQNATDGQAQWSTNWSTKWNTNVSLSPDYCQKIVDSLSSLTADLELPKHLRNSDARKTNQDFNINKYFMVLDRLSMEPGFFLDYVYYYGGIGGEPVLYARKVELPAYRDFKEFSAERGDSVSASSEEEYLSHIEVNATPEGFFQLYAMKIMGGQFYLFWHASYDDYRIVCNSSDAALYLSDPILVSQASQMNFTPTVEMNDEAVRVSAVVFTKWGGFMRKSITFAAKFPHRVLKEASQDIIPYNCGILF